MHEVRALGDLLVRHAVDAEHEASVLLSGERTLEASAQAKGP